MPTPTQTRRIIIKVDASGSDGLREIASKLGLLNKNAKSLSDTVSNLSHVFQGWLAYLGIRELVSLSDTMQNLFNRLKIVTGGADNAQKALADIADIASRTYQPVEQVGQVFTRMAVALGNAHASVGELQAITETLTDTFRIAGSSPNEITGAVIQLSQAFSLGTLRGQELRSVMTENATLAQLLSKKFGPNLFEEAKKGSLSVVKVLEVLRDNMAFIITKAAELTPTFEQTITKAMNKLALAVDQVNRQFQLSAGFASVMEVAMQKLSLALTVVAGTVGLLALTYLPQATVALLEFSKAAIVFAASNPLLLAFTTISIAIISTFRDLNEFRGYLKNLQADFKEFSAGAPKINASNIFKLILGENPEEDTANLNKVRSEINQLRNDAYKLANTPITSSNTQSDVIKKYQDQIDSLIKKVAELNKGKLEKPKEKLAELNKEFLSGAIGISEYNKRLIEFQLYKVNFEFQEGKTDIFKYNEALRDLKLQELGRQFAAGKLSLQEFNDQVASQKLKVLNDEFIAGRINIQKYTEEITKLEDKFRPGAVLSSGVHKYLEGSKGLAESIAGNIKDTFDNLETQLTNFIKTGKFNFQDFAQFVIDELNHVIVRALIVAPIARGILGLIPNTYTGGGGGGVGGLNAGGRGVSLQSAHGNAFGLGGNVLPFAKGGVVSSPTAFSFGGGRSGLMGESGAEAILPLSRGGNGNLGVEASVTPVTVNIINQTGASVQQRESTGPGGERTLDILITSKVREGITTGKFDTAFKSAYSLSRKGS